MKKIFTAVFATATLLVVTTSCKKDKPLTTTQKIQNKWSIENLYYNDFYSGVNHINTNSGLTGDYADFRVDSKVYSNINGTKDTMVYQINSDTKITIDGSVFDIQKLTESSFVIYTKEFYTSTDFDESKLSLKR